MPKAIAFWAFWSDEVFLPAALLTCRPPHNAQILAKKKQGPFLVVPASIFFDHAIQRTESTRSSLLRERRNTDPASQGCFENRISYRSKRS